MLNSLFQSIQKAALPGIWSKGVALSREVPVIEDARSDDEIILKLQLPNRPVSPKVSLWPEDEDWHCDCGDRNDLCIHIVAAAVALKNGLTRKPETNTNTTRIEYRLLRVDQELHLERWILRGGDQQKLSGSLVSLVGGITSGRVASPVVTATQEDFAVDHALGTSPKAQIEKETWPRLLVALKNCGQVTLDGQSVQISAQSLSPEFELTDEGSGFRFRLKQRNVEQEIFKNGITRVGNTLRPYDAPASLPEETSFRLEDAARLAAEILPVLQTKFSVEILTQRLPRLRRERPRILLKTQTLGDQILSVTPVLAYGSPVYAEIHQDRIESLDSANVPNRDSAAEKELQRKLQSELHLQTDQPARFEGVGAVDFLIRVQGWDTTGPGVEAFGLREPLTPRLRIGSQDFKMEIPGADSERVLQAWQNGESYVPLLNGGWAPLPKDWLSKYGEKVLALLENRREGKLPPHLLPALADLGEELGEKLPEGLRRLKDALDDTHRIPDTLLPADLRASLRSYQKQGVNWLCFLRNAGMGALLADDMGLGKTIQALAAFRGSGRGRNLVICPTSVLQSWADQCAQFRPGLKISKYYGNDRKLDPAADVTLTSYGILRLDADALAAESWDTVVLDEAQTIRNPESQIARAAHRLKAGFRLALSGTPVENRLEDLWSQFQFLNPGLLGSRQTFAEQLSIPSRLRQRIRPFLLRRLKREVAPELPPRTETTLHCELNTNEREVYSAILAATQQEVLKQLESGGSVIAALEAILRLRQACCHPALVPGQVAENSSKVELLLQSLESSVAEGHRSLVFSQWTSFLDLIEIQLRNAGINFLRLDGSTPNRGEIVAKFQNPAGPPVLLMSLKAGGVGLTLTAADHVFLMDPWWNPAAEDQAADRAHRIGQENPVLIHRLIAKDTLEEGIIALQARKRGLAQAVLEDAAGALSLTRDDLIELLRTTA